jgi:hypothetical protein
MTLAAFGRFLADAGLSAGASIVAGGYVVTLYRAGSPVACAAGSTLTDAVRYAIAQAPRVAIEVLS